MKPYTIFHILIQNPLVHSAKRKSFLLLLGFSGLIACGTKQKLEFGRPTKHNTESKPEDMQTDSNEVDSNPHKSTNGSQDGTEKVTINPTAKPTTTTQNRWPNLKASFEPANVSLELQGNCGACHQSFYELPAVQAKKNEILGKLWAKKMPPANGNYGLSAEALPVVTYLVCVAKAQNPGFKITCP